MTGARLNWSAATDDVGVAGYRVYRDGVQVGTTSGRTYLDAGTQPQTTYAYEVRARDGDGNVSALSAPVTVRV